MVESTYFGPAPKSDFSRDDDLRWQRNQTVSFAKIITGSLQVGQELTSANWVAGVSGWYIDGDGNAQFNDVTVRGDLLGNWNGAIPADLSVIDPTADSGFYLDSSVGTGQFAENLYIGSAVSGYVQIQTGGVNAVDLNFIDSDGDFAAQINMLGTDTSGTFSISGPRLGLSATTGDISLSGTEINAFAKMRYDLTPGAANEHIVFTDADYSIFQDNTGSGSDGSRWWLDAPDGGQVVLGPRAGNSYLDDFDSHNREMTLRWEDSGGDNASHAFPKGIIYDWGTTASNSDTSAIGTSETSILSVTATVPANVSVTIVMWANVRFDNSGDNSNRNVRAYIGGSTQYQAMIMAHDLTTGSGGTGNTGSNGGQLITLAGNSGPASAGTAHTHTVGAYNPSDTSDHTHTGPSHTHTLSGSWHTISLHSMRSFTPTGTTVTVEIVGQTASGTQVFSARALSYMVIIN